MTWLGWIVIGGLAGLIAKAIMKEEGGLLKNIIVGILGAVLGGWLFSLVGADGFGDAGWIWSLLVAVVGAVVLIWLIRLVTGKK
ncbi:MAG TPA: GlsB/YeaQ/YmgE family stress response membrane protein [Candidatus Saccharibacteria bacterium]|nr:GlsB/YeaQ/YmgE family stress response membrane protein [Candidatus Saccharibacteria bacterium]